VTAEPVVVQLHIDAPPDVVFDCFCDADALMTWMGAAARTEPWPGGAFAVDIDGMLVRGEFKVVERPSRLVFSWGFANEKLAPGASTVEVTLVERRGGTQLTLTHRDLPHNEVSKHEHGWARFLPVLAEVAARPSTRFEAVVRAFANNPDVSPPDRHLAPGRKFGSNGLKFRGKIFAMLSRDQLVVKLPEQRVIALVTSGHGQRMISGGSREMKEWLVVDSGSRLDWIGLAREACEFVKRELHHKVLT
jgi:uncharacterized protein YndB with AHSA1/START domain